MKIGLPPEINTAGQDASVRGKHRSPTTSEASAPSVDKVDLSAAGSQISASHAGMDFDSAKVDAIKEAIRQGRFSVNPEVISDRLIAEASALLRPKVH